jgi:hypothetical protein
MKIKGEKYGKKSMSPTPLMYTYSADVYMYPTAAAAAGGTLPLLLAPDGRPDAEVFAAYADVC